MRWPTRSSGVLAYTTRIACRDELPKAHMCTLIELCALSKRATASIFQKRASAGPARMAGRRCVKVTENHRRASRNISLSRFTAAASPSGKRGAPQRASAGRRRRPAAPRSGAQVPMLKWNTAATMLEAEPTSRHLAAREAASTTTTTSSPLCAKALPSESRQWPPTRTRPGLRRGAAS